MSYAHITVQSHGQGEFTDIMDALLKLQAHGVTHGLVTPKLQIIVGRNLDEAARNVHKAIGCGDLENKPFEIKTIEELKKHYSN